MKRLIVVGAVLALLVPASASASVGKTTKCGSMREGTTEFESTSMVHGIRPMSCKAARQVIRKGLEGPADGPIYVNGKRWQLDESGSYDGCDRAYWRGNYRVYAWLTDPWGC